MVRGPRTPTVRKEPAEEPAPEASAAVKARRRSSGRSKAAHVGVPLATIGAISLLAGNIPPGTAPQALSPSSSAPTPIIEQHDVKWLATFKFNAATAPTDPASPLRACTFGGSKQTYRQFGQSYAVATDEDAELKAGDGLVGVGTSDPVGETFGKIYRGSYHYVVWNDQFYDSPKINGCSGSCSSPWGHSKGILAWDDSGEGTVLQVTTPSWPASGSGSTPRVDDGNTLGCIEDNNLLVSQDFFALRLSKPDVIQVLKALANSSVVTDPSDPQLVNNGGPQEISDLVSKLGVVSPSTGVTKVTLSSGIQLISKPSKLHVPPWQLVSSELGSVPLKVATWWAAPKIPSTDSTTAIDCWDKNLPAPGAVTIVQYGQWQGKRIGLQGGAGPAFNHAKIGVSVGGDHHYSIFGDMNQQGALTGNCGSSQNGRGGMFYVVDDSSLADSISTLLTDPQASSLR